MTETYELSTNVVKINFKDIIRNSLTREYWEKKWCIFEYADVKITLNITAISVSSQQVEFKIEVRTHNDSDWNHFSLPLKQYNEKAFQKKLMGVAHRTIETLERNAATQTDEYDKLVDEERLADEAQLRSLNDYLDENNVTVEDIREAYIEQNREYANFTYKLTGSYVRNHMLLIHNQLDAMVEFEEEQ